MSSHYQRPLSIPREATAPHAVRAGYPPLLLMAAGYVVPLLGVGASIAGTMLLAIAAPAVWPRRRRLATTSAACLAFAASWFGVVLSFAGMGGSWVPTRMEWLLIPLCAPTSAVAWVVAPLASIAAYASFAWLSVRTNVPLLWPVGALAATVLYELAAGSAVGGLGGWQC